MKVWNENPILTSVGQISTEKIMFPSVTVCLLDFEEKIDHYEVDIDIKELVMNCSYTKNNKITRQIYGSNLQQQSHPNDKSKLV